MTKFSQQEDTLRTADSLAEYSQQVFDKIKQLTLLDRPKSEKGSVNVSFTLDASGRLKGEPRINSSTNYSLVPTAVRNIVSASPFPPFPRSMDKAEESFRISLEYN
jgi:TonB family protein